MSKLHGKSVLLGMGIGTILTALLGLIFFLGYTPDMDEAKVKEQARKYGMIDSSELPGKVTIEVQKEDTLSDITNKLEKAGLVKEPVSFQIKAASRKVKDNILPGTYEFAGYENDEGILDILTKSVRN